MNGSFQEAYQAYSAMIYARCLHILGNEQDALDAFQEVALKLQVHLREFLAAESRVGWLYQVPTHTCLNHLRTKKRRHLSDWEQLDGEGSIEPASQEDIEKRVASAQELALLLKRVPSRYRDVLVMYYRDGMTQEEIASVLGKSRITVARAMKEIQELIERTRDETARRESLSY